MKTLSQRITDAQTNVVTLRDQLNEHIANLDDNPDDAATSVTDDLTTKIDAQEKSLEALQRAEAQLAKNVERSSVSNVVVHQDRGSEQSMDLRTSHHRPFAVPAQKVRPSDYLFRAVAMDLKHFGEERRRPILDVIKENYGDGEQGEITRVVMSRLVTKAAAIPADTTTSGWADKLVQTVIGDFIESLMPYTIYPRLSSMGASFTFGRNGVISLPSRDTSTLGKLGGAFVAQGAAIPVKQGVFAAITLTPKKMGVITTMTREITEHSTPAIEAILRQAILEDTGYALDVILLDATAADTTRPAGLLAVGTAVTATTFTGITGFVADVKALTAALIVQTRGNIRNPVWIMNPGDALSAQLLQTTVGETPFRDEIAGGTLLGYPILTSTVCAADKMLLVDAADFATATGDTPQFSVSDQAVLHMEDTSPAAISAVGTPNVVAAPLRSLWQTDSIAVRMILDVNWALRRSTGMVQWIASGLTWN